MKKRLLIFSAILLALAAGCFAAFKKANPTRPLESYLPNKSVQEESATVQNQSSKEKTYAFVGPRDNIPAGAPKEEGFWSFAYPVPGVLSRSGQPTLDEFRFLKDNGWKSVIDMRVDGDHNENADDAQIPGFNDLGFNYLRIQIIDGAAPTDQQGETFLKFVTDPANQPAHVHCRGGIGRAGTMVALYRYSVQGWPMDKAIDESREFSGGVSKAQKKWLLEWASNHSPGSYAK